MDSFQDTTGQLREDNPRVHSQSGMCCYPLYTKQNTTDKFLKRPAEKTRNLSTVFLFTLIQTNFEVVCTVCGCCSHRKKCKVPKRWDSRIPFLGILVLYTQTRETRTSQGLLPLLGALHFSDPNVTTYQALLQDQKTETLFYSMPCF